MATDKLEAYYWYVYALIFESDDILLLGDPDFTLSDVDTASIAQGIRAVLPFRDRSRLYAEIGLAVDGKRRISNVELRIANFLTAKS